MNYGERGCSSQKDKQEETEMEHVGVDGVVFLLGFLITPFWVRTIHHRSPRLKPSVLTGASVTPRLPATSCSLPMI